MAVFNAKAWFRNQIKPYLKKIKEELDLVGNVTGQYSGLEATFAALPTTDLDGSPLESGDWAILTADDGVNEAGIYVTDGTTWSFAMKMIDFGDILDSLIATDAEVVTGTATDKVASVDQLNRYYAKINGSNTEKFSAMAADEDTDEVLNANQFATADLITDAEAVADWDAA